MAILSKDEAQTILKKVLSYSKADECTAVDLDTTRISGISRRWPCRSRRWFLAHYRVSRSRERGATLLVIVTDVRTGL